jgi:hypothetical protein
MTSTPASLLLQLLLLNGCHDRETSTCGCHTGAMRASDVVTAVTDALNRRRSRQVGPAVLRGWWWLWVLTVAPTGPALQISDQHTCEGEIVRRDT